MSTLIETIFSSKARIRILKVLLAVKEINITSLTRKVKANYGVVKYHIDVLKSLGIVEEKKFGRIRIIRLRDSDPKVKLIEKVFNELSNLEKLGGTESSEENENLSQVEEKSEELSNTF